MTDSQISDFIPLQSCFGLTFGGDGAGEGTRTLTVSLPSGLKPDVSANYTTPAGVFSADVFADFIHLTGVP